MADPLERLHDEIYAAADSLREGTFGGAVIGLERPPRPELGDYSTNAAMLLAPGRGERPREVAELLRGELERRLGDSVERFEIAGPGFLNLFLSGPWYRRAVRGVLDAGPRYAAAGARSPERVSVEFVSANPTGPLTAAGGRHAAFGDSLARVLDFVGHRVEREYYVNDVGGQVERLAESVAARMRGDAAPENGYEGEYVVALAAELAEEGVEDADLEVLGRLSAERMQGAIRATLERFGVEFDNWVSERSLHESGAVERSVEELRERGAAYESEAATWLRTSAFGDDKDRVLIRSTGEPTYFAADVAYHRDKLERGAERMLDVLGADHHGYVPRMRAAIEAFGSDPERYEVVIMQLVHLVDAGERAQMSKRKGDFVTLDELVEDIGVDAARFFMLQRSHDTTVDLDLDLARQRSSDNPVYYVQYAHARLCGILQLAGDGDSGPANDEAVAAPVEPAEQALVKRLLEFPAELEAAATRRAPHRLCAYATATAADVHAFYRDCKVVGAPSAVQAARLELCVATRQVIARTLELLGVSAPESM
jgi:arginyl-tRNA synthetase